MTPVSAEQFLADQFPLRLRPLIPTTLKTAYSAAKTLIDGEPIAVPHPIRKRNFVFRSPNLLNMPHEVPSDVPAVEETDLDATISLKEEIEKWRRDNGE